MIRDIAQFLESRPEPQYRTSSVICANGSVAATTDQHVSVALIKARVNGN